jgi:transposase
MAQSFLDAGWLMLKNQLSYKAKGQGLWCVEIDEAYST